MPRPTRRDTLRALPALAGGLTAGLAGCSALRSDDDSLSVATAWQRPVDRPARPVQPPAGPLLVGSRSPFDREPMVTALDPATGEPRWSVDGSERASPVGADADLAVVVAKTGTTLGLETDTGDERWREREPGVDQPDPGVVAFAPVLTPELAVVPVSGTESDVDDRLVGRERADGRQRYRHALPASLGGAPAADGDGVVFPLVDGTLRRLGPDGRETWRVDEGAALSGVAVAKGTAYVASARERLLAVDTDAGEVRWRASLANVAFPPPFVADGRVFVGAADYRLYAFDAATGERLWRRDTGNAVTSGPTPAGDALVALSGGHARDREPAGTVPFDPVVLSVHGRDGEQRLDHRFDPFVDGGDVRWAAGTGSGAYVGQDRMVSRLAPEVVER